MRKLWKKSSALFLALIFTVMAVLPVAASQATSYTYTMDDQSEMVRTQDAYLPDRTITDLGLSDPEDMIIDDNNQAYIVDTGNRRIVIFDLNTEKVVKVINKQTVESKILRDLILQREFLEQTKEKYMLQIPEPKQYSDSQKTLNM